MPNAKPVADDGLFGYEQVKSSLCQNPSHYSLMTVQCLKTCGRCGTSSFKCHSPEHISSTTLKLGRPIGLSKSSDRNKVFDGLC
jgi:ShK domain-like